MVVFVKQKKNDWLYEISFRFFRLLMKTRIAEFSRQQNCTFSYTNVFLQESFFLLFKAKTNLRLQKKSGHSISCFFFLICLVFPKENQIWQIFSITILTKTLQGLVFVTEKKTTFIEEINEWSILLFFSKLSLLFSPTQWNNSWITFQISLPLRGEGDK